MAMKDLKTTTMRKARLVGHEMTEWESRLHPDRVDWHARCITCGANLHLHGPKRQATVSVNETGERCDVRRGRHA